MSLQILVTDDDSVIRHLIKDCLELHGYSVILAQDGQEALILARQYHPHLLISDIRMPKKDGYQLVKELRQYPSFRLLPVVFLTHKHSLDDKIHGYQVGCDAYLSKPFQPNELIAIVHHLLERSQIITSEILYTEIDNSHDSSFPFPADEADNKILFDSHFTDREKEVLSLLTQGLSNGKIAEKLYLSPKTVEKYVGSLLRKTNANNRTELVSFALKNHLINY